MTEQICIQIPPSKRQRCVNCDFCSTGAVNTRPYSVTRSIFVFTQHPCCIHCNKNTAQLGVYLINGRLGSRSNTFALPKSQIVQ